MKTVLFLCTGNYYRSRIAEEVFNHRACREALDWVAQSRALAIELGKNNIGSLSPLALEGLRKRGFVSRSAGRSPQQCTIDDLKGADRIVAVKESEHRPLMLGRFPDWERRTEYWQVDDVDLASPDVTFGCIEQEIEALLAKLHAVCS